MDHDNWNIECSDEECEIKNGVLVPPVGEIVDLYTLLDEGKMPEFRWQSPGYRSPTPTNDPITPVKEEQTLTEEKSDFDFMDDLSSPKLPVINIIIYCNLNSRGFPI